MRSPTLRSCQRHAAHPMDTSTDSAADADPRHSVAGQLWAFVRRDIRSFRWWRPKDAKSNAGGVPEVQHNALDALDQDIPSEVDLGLIKYLQFRRELLDWRDEFHFRVTECATQAEQALTAQVHQELSTMGFLRGRLFTQPAGEILANHIESVVRAPMRSTVQAQQSTLHAHLQNWFHVREQSPRCFVLFPKLEWDTRLSLKFTADNRERILAELHELILGAEGIADTYRQWATDQAAQIQQRYHAQPNPV